MMNETITKLPAMMDEIRANLEWLESNLPKSIDGWALSRLSKLPWKVLLYREALNWRMAEVARSALEALESNRLVSGIALTRTAVETSAALWFLCGKVTNVVNSKAIGDVDEYLMKLAMGTATGAPPNDPDPPGSVELPRPVKISAFLKAVEKDIEGFSYQYGMLSEYAHPNWSGTVLLYSKTDTQTAVTEFGQNIRKADKAEVVGVVNLSVALRIFHAKHERIGELLPDFIGVCESELAQRQAG